MNQKIENLITVLQETSAKFDKVCFSTSMSAEDMILSHVISEHKIPITVFTLDTGRLHDETYQLMQTVQERYHKNLKIYFPEAEDLETFINTRGTNAFYQSIDFRKVCCQIRKVQPLKRALEGQQVWVTGLRKQQSMTREGLEVMAWDDGFSLYKLNPLLDWSSEETWSFIRENDVPYNVLHDRGFPSVGCSPCTRAVAKVENERAGRWWWESPETKECGLHVSKGGNEIVPETGKSKDVA